MRLTAQSGRQVNLSILGNEVENNSTVACGLMQRVNERWRDVEAFILETSNGEHGQTK